MAALVLSSLAWAAGCGSGTWWEGVRRRAGRDLDCPPQAVSAEPLAYGVVQARGCLHARDYLVRGHGVTPIAPLREVAERETGCDTLTLEAPYRTIRLAIGCGRVTRFDLACGDDGRCHWLPTASATQVASATPPSAPTP
jgi:hypothetical protein